jgi:hypothetical protein
MLVYYFVEVDLPFEIAEERLLRNLGALGTSADIAFREGESLGARVGLALPIAKAVDITVGRPLRGETHMTVPLVWEASGSTALFPRMEADLILTRLGATYSHLSFRGSYKPPLGVVGMAIDKILHPVAEGTVRRFTDRLAASLLAEARSGAGTNGHTAARVRS